MRAVREINAQASNPLDLIGDAKPADYKAALGALQTDPEVDLIYALLTPQSMTDPNAVARIISEQNKKKPVLASFIGGRAVNGAINIMKENNVAVFETPERGIKALSQLKEYYERKHIERIFNIPVMKRRRVSRAISGRKGLPIREAFKLLQSEGIQTPKTHFITDAKAIRRLKLTFPLAIKAATGRVHKTDLGLVKANIKSLAELEETAKEMFDKLSVFNEKPLLAVQEMIYGREVIVSAIKTEFGTVITYGTGGVFVEVMHDFSQKIAPLTASDVDEMFNEVNGTEILKGIRGEKKLDITSLKKLIKAVAKIALTYPEINEMELNPVIVTQNGCYAVDAAVKIQE